MEETRRRTHLPQVTDLLEFVALPKAVDPAFIRHLYLEKGLTTSQIAERVGLSKAAILARLHQMGIRKQPDRGLQSDNYRFSNRVPFGKRLVEGRLIDDRRELKAARLIVELRLRQQLSWSEVVQKVNLAGFRTKKGLFWKLGTTRMVYEKWRDKV